MVTKIQTINFVTLAEALACYLPIVRRAQKAMQDDEGESFTLNLEVEAHTGES